MKGIDFWKRDAKSVLGIMEAVDRLSENTYRWVTDLKAGMSWCSEQTKEYFGLPEQLYENFESVMAEYVHPYDRMEYREGIVLRMRGEKLDEELCVRLKGPDGSYYMFSLHTAVVGSADYFVVTIRNENIFPEIDALTDLYSQTRYVQDIRSAIERGQPFAVLQIGVAGFHNFNIIYGGDFSDELLRQMALQFIYRMEEKTAVYRMEGEEFAFILKDSGREELVAFEQKMREMLGEGIEVMGKKIPLKISAGAILLEDYHGDGISIRSKASYALSHSAQEHQGQLVIFNDEVRTARGVDLELMKVIHQSVREDCSGFYVEYQPVVDSRTGRIVGAEALVRWRREPYGTVPPGMFIEWMETDPSMYELGNHVLRTACSEMKPILSIYPEFFINVNISVRQMERPEFRGAVKAILQDTHFPATRLCMELTERCKDFPLDVLRREVDFFREHGIRVAMDDYGTGSASSSIVMNVPVDEIKIDMSFVRGIIDNPLNQAMVSSIVNFANQSGINTCIEGVENKELETYLRGYNATWFQGYLYAKPLPVDKLVGMIREQKAS